MTRTRTKVNNRNVQHVYRNIGGVVITDHDEVVDSLDVCKDDVCPYPYTANIPMQIDHYDRSGIICSGDSNPGGQNGSSRTVITSWIPDYVAGVPITHAPFAGVPTPGDDALKVLAFTNPNRGSGVDIGEDIIESLTGLPVRIKRTGDLITDGASGHLWWSFGYGPLIEDILKLMDYQEVFEQRLREFNSLFKKGGLRREVQLGTYSNAGTSGSIVYQSNYFSLVGEHRWRSSMTRWGVVRWHPHGWSLLDISEKEMRGRLRRLLYGLDASPDSIWRKIPWTWLIGWFSTVGLWLRANKNNFPVIPGPVCIMDTTDTQISFRRTSSTSWIGTTGSTYGRKTLQRHVVPSGGIPIHFFRPNNDFGLGKSSILGSLAITRLGKP